jgi:hypothetical protein
MKTYVWTQWRIMMFWTCFCFLVGTCHIVPNEGILVGEVRDARWNYLGGI